MGKETIIRRYQASDGFAAASQKLISETITVPNLHKQRDYRFFNMSDRSLGLYCPLSGLFLLVPIGYLSESLTPVHSELFV